MYHLQALEPGKWMVSFSPSPKTWELGWPTSESRRCVSQASRERLSLPLPFCSVLGLNGPDGVTHLGEGDLLYSVYQCKCWPLPETPSQTHPEMFYQVAGHPLTQSNAHKNLTFTQAVVLAQARLMGALAVEIRVSLQNLSCIPSWTWDPLITSPLCRCPDLLEDCRWQGTQDLLSACSTFGFYFY